MKLRKRKSKEDIEEETTTKRRKTEGEENKYCVHFLKCHVKCASFYVLSNRSLASDVNIDKITC